MMGPTVMLTAIPRSAATLSEALWIDLLDPTDDERRRVEEATKLRMPTKAAIEEIESSSRVMNLKVMRELGWRLGYPVALILIVVSALLPVAWFKWRGWI